MRIDTKFLGDDLRKIDPKFKQPRYQQYLKAVDLLDKFTKEKCSKQFEL
jgi:hypothetical protein